MKKEILKKTARITYKEAYKTLQIVRQDLKDCQEFMSDYNIERMDKKLELASDLVLRGFIYHTMNQSVGTLEQCLENSIKALDIFTIMNCYIEDAQQEEDRIATERMLQGSIE